MSREVGSIRRHRGMRHRRAGAARSWSTATRRSKPCLTAARQGYRAALLERDQGPVRSTTPPDHGFRHGPAEARGSRSAGAGLLDTVIVVGGRWLCSCPAGVRVGHCICWCPLGTSLRDTLIGKRQRRHRGSRREHPLGRLSCNRLPGNGCAHTAGPARSDPRGRADRLRHRPLNRFTAPGIPVTQPVGRYQTGKGEVRPSVAPYNSACGQCRLSNDASRSGPSSNPEIALTCMPPASAPQSFRELVSR